jgi:hypothetical protein
MGDRTCAQTLCRLLSRFDLRYSVSVRETSNWAGESRLPLDPIVVIARSQ